MLASRLQAFVPMAGEDIARRLLLYAAAIGTIVEQLPDSRLGRHVAGQLVRCGTSPGPNYEEARAAESPRDFVHKLAVCLKELRESVFWLKYVRMTKLLAPKAVDAEIQEGTELCKIIGKSISTTKKRQL